MEIKDVEKWFESEENVNRAEEYFGRLSNVDKMIQSQIDRFRFLYNDTNKFSKLVEKIVVKYNSDEYVKREYSKGRMPNEELYFFLFNYASKYGEEATSDEYAKYGNTFTSAIYTIHGYYFHQLNGQGTIIQIFKKQ